MTSLKGHIEPTQKRYRVLFNGVYVADTISAQFVWETDYYPIAYIPLKDIQTKYLSTPKENKEEDVLERVSQFGKAKRLRLDVKGRVTEDVHVIVQEGHLLKDYVRFGFDAMDQWFEEDTPIYVHPKDPYKRVDVLPSSRHIVVKLDGVVLAETHSPTLLFETLLPTRYYMPKTALKWEYLEESGSVTKCPYKGEANYYSVNINGQKYEDIIWWYRYPASESLGIIGLASFYNSKVDIYIDGVLESK